jgi:ABC-type sugar transport system ATPase subunit
MGDRVVVVRDGTSIAEISGDALSEQSIMSAIAEGRSLSASEAQHG